jgi:hypothetical protein
MYNLPDYFHNWLFFFWRDTLFQFWLLTKKQDVVGESVSFQFYIKKHVSTEFTFLFWSLTQSCKMSYFSYRKSNHLDKNKKCGCAMSKWIYVLYWCIRKAKSKFPYDHDRKCLSLASCQNILIHNEAHCFTQKKMLKLENLNTWN